MASNDCKQTRIDRFKRVLGKTAEQSGEAVAKAAKRADEALTAGADRAGVSGQLNTARETVKRSTEVISGSDIRHLDEFTDAVTRVLMGLHRETAVQAERITTLEQTVSQLQQRLNEEAK